MCPKDADQAHKAVGMNAGSDAASNISSSGIASSVTPPENDCPSQDNDCSKRLSPSDEGRPVSRKMARKLKKMGATSNKESRLQYAEKVSASIEIPSKPRSSKPRAGKRKVAPAPKHASKTGPNALVHASSCAETVPTARQVPCPTATNCTKLDQNQTIMMATKHSKEQLFRQEEEHEGEKCIPVEKRKIYKNNMTEEEYLDLLEQDIFEKGLLDHVSTNWCLEQLD